MQGLCEEFFAVMLGDQNPTAELLGTLAISQITEYLWIHRHVVTGMIVLWEFLLNHYELILYYRRIFSDIPE